MKRCLVIFSFMITVVSCRKQLLQPVASDISAIDDLEDCESLLNNIEFFGKQPAATEISSDNYYYKDSSLEQLPESDRRLYLWEADLYKGEHGIVDYNQPYKQVGRINEILYALQEITVDPLQAGRKDNIEGTCRFHRSYAFYNLLQLYARPYDATTAETDTGIALVLTRDKDTDYRRSSMKTSYETVIADLIKASQLLPLLPDKVKRHKPSKVAAWALLARTFLSMRDYPSAEQYADSALKYYALLFDYNTAINIKPFPFGAANPEVIYQAFLHDESKLLKGRAGNETLIDSVLYSYYDSNDLRKTLYYRASPDKKPTLNGSYTGTIFCFGGLATDELYLIRAECAARKDHITEAMATLNELLSYRYKKGSFLPLSVHSKDSALFRIHRERRKELAFRGLRWTDLRRMNKEYPTQTIRRIAGGVIYELLPNDLRYTFPIPGDALAGSQMIQNPRK